MYIQKPNIDLPLNLSPPKPGRGIKMKGSMIKLLVYLTLLFLAAMQPMQPVHAAGAIGNVESFDNLAGDARYLGSVYRDNYHLDMEETGLLDAIPAILNGLSNVLFSFIRWLAYLTVALFYICFNLNLADLFGSQANDIQNALNNSIFQPLFLLGCGVSFCILAIRFVKQDLAGAVGQLAKIIGIVMLSVAAVTNSGTVLTYCTNITKEISVNILSGINTVNGYSANISDFAAQGAGILWLNLIHEPWKTMEFGNDSPSDEDIDLFLTTAPGSDGRKALIESHAWDCFSMDRAGDKIGFMILYLIPFAMKCVVYILVAVIQLVFQLLAIFYVFMAPLVLIISLIPGYERMLGLWLRKIMESQISILIITIMIGVLIKLDQLLFDWARNMQYGWMIALVIQVALALALFFKRDKILNLMSNIQRGVTTPGFTANRFRMGGNVYQSTIPDTVKYGGKLGKVLYGYAADTVVKFGGKRSSVREHLGEDTENEKSSVKHKTFTKEAGEWNKTENWMEPDNSNDYVQNRLTGETRKRLSVSKPEIPAVIQGSPPTLPLHEEEPDIRIQEIRSTDNCINEKTGTRKEEERSASPVQIRQSVNQNQESASGLQKGMEHLADIMESTVSGTDSGGKETERPILMPGPVREEKDKDTKPVSVAVHLNMGGKEQTVSGTAGDSSSGNDIQLRTVPEKNNVHPETKTENIREQMAAVRGKNVKDSQSESAIPSPALEHDSNHSGKNIAVKDGITPYGGGNKMGKSGRKALNNYSASLQAPDWHQKNVSLMTENKITGNGQYSRSETSNIEEKIKEEAVNEKTTEAESKGADRSVSVKSGEQTREPSVRDKNAYRYDSRPGLEINTSPDKKSAEKKAETDKVIQPNKTVKSENQDSSNTKNKANSMNKTIKETTTERNSPLKKMEGDISANKKSTRRTQNSPKLELTKEKSN